MSGKLSLLLSAQLGQTAQLTQDLADLQMDRVVSGLLSSVVQNPQTETISFNETRTSVLRHWEGLDSMLTHKTRGYILRFLNNVMLSSLGFRTWLAEDPLCVWFWENHTRLCKLACVAMTLESSNLIRLGAVPEKLDIPQALIRIPFVISRLRDNQFKILEAVHVKLIDEVGASSGFGKDYLSIFLSQ